MSSITLTLPDDVEERLRIFAENRGSTLQEILIALAEAICTNEGYPVPTSERQVDFSKLHPEIQEALLRA